MRRAIVAGCLGSAAALVAMGWIGARALCADAAPTTAPAAVTEPAASDPTAAAPAAPVELSSRPFESPSGGISLHFPVGGKPLLEPVKDELVEFQDANRRSKLVVERKTYTQPMTLTTISDSRGRTQLGILDDLSARITKELADPSKLIKGQPGLKMLRQDTTNLGNYDVGMLAYRYTKDAGHWFEQVAIIEANDRMFYLISYITPGREDLSIPLTRDGDEATTDPGEAGAVATFRHVLDSVKLLDRKAIYDDQVQRLFRTRVLLENWKNTLTDKLIPEQYFRIVREDGPGKTTDVGWRYVVEEPDQMARTTGIRVGMHTCMSDVGPGKPTVKAPRREEECWLSATTDCKHEDWNRQIVIADGQPHTREHPWPKMVELGVSDLTTSRYLVADSHKLADMYKQGTNEDPHQPWMGTHDHHALKVEYIGTMGSMDPVNRPLPPFYLPQAMDAVLPQLLPPNEVKTYMLATYVADAREVMTRYIEVRPLSVVEFNGRTIKAIPITDHITLQGAITTHYLTPTGEYLGSECKDTRILVLPSDRQTILKIWPDADPKRPADLREGGNEAAAPAAPAAAPARGTISVGAAPPPDARPRPVLPGQAAPGPQQPETALPDNPFAPPQIPPDQLTPLRRAQDRPAPGNNR